MHSVLKYATLYMVRVNKTHVHEICAKRGVKLTELLRRTGISRTAFYHLARKRSVLPRSLRTIADKLGVAVSELLMEEPLEVQRMHRLLEEVDAIMRSYPNADRDNVRHTLLLLEDPPLKRLRRALRRAQT